MVNRQQHHRFRATLTFLRSLEWCYILGIGLVGFIFGVVGFSQYLTGRTIAWHQLPDIIYQVLELLVLQFNPAPSARPIPGTLHLARYLLAFAAFWTAIKALRRLFAEQLQLLKVKFYRRHIVVCGLDQKGSTLVKKLREERRRVVVIEQDAENDMIQPCRELGAIVFVGNATDDEVLRKAGVPNAQYLISVCGDYNTNVEIATHARQLVAGRPRQWLTCFVHIDDPYLCQLLGGKEIGVQKTESFALEFFNVYRRGAQLLLEEHSPFIIGPDTPIHVLIVGSGLMAHAFIERLVREWRRKFAAEHGRIRVTVVGKNARPMVRTLRLRYPRFREVCAATALDIDYPSPDFERGNFLFSQPGVCDVTQAYVCLDTSNDSFSAALALAWLLRRFKVPIVAVVDREVGLAEILKDYIRGGDSFDTPRVFGLLDQACDPKLLLGGTTQAIARAIHEMYRRHSKSLGCTPEDKPSMVEWEKLPAEFKLSSLRAASYIGERLEKIGCRIAPLVDWDADLFRFTCAEVELLAKMEHERLLRERLQNGWRPGNMTDYRRRQHVSLVPYDQLSNSDKRFNQQIVRELPAVLYSIDLEICRVSYELLANALLNVYRMNSSQTKGPGPNSGESEDAWARRYAREIVDELTALGYRIRPLERPLAPPPPLPEHIAEEMCKKENSDWGRLDPRVRRQRLEAAKRLPEILGSEEVCAAIEWTETIEPDQTELLAIALHERYQNACRAAGQTPTTNPALVEWRRLPESLKESNRREATHILAMLRAIGCGTEPLDDTPSNFTGFTEAEIEKMAQLEHERWKEEQEDEGWEYGPEKNLRLRTNPYLVPWAELPEDIKDYNRNAVKEIPKLLAKISRRVYRKSEGGQLLKNRLTLLLSNPEMREAIARAIHETLMREREKRGFLPDSDYALAPWESLPQDLRESNRAQADSIVEKLQWLGLDVEPADTGPGEPFAFTAEEVERLATADHERWLKERLSAGWRFAPGPKDVKQRTSPYLVPWDELSEEAKELDRAVVRLIPQVLARVGLRIVRRKAANG